MSELETKIDDEAASPELELQEEQQLGGTPAGKAANDALRALSRAARAFALYDPGNEAIHRFLEEYRARMGVALHATGRLDFEVRPFEFALGGEVVYLERDRERSLAFRLFRDGVRRLVIPAGVAFDELLRLLEVLSVRFAGVRQQEDDVVTLLTKASFRQISFEAVEGFVAHDDEEETGASEGIEGLGSSRPLKLDHVTAPADFDAPFPPALQPRAFGFRAVPPSYLEALRAEETSENVPAQAVRMVRELLAAAADAPAASGAIFAHGPTTIAGVRDFLVADGRVGAIVELVGALRAADGRGSELDALLVPLGTEEVLARLLESATGDERSRAEALGRLLEAVPGDHVSHLLSLLEKSADDEGRTGILCRLLTQRVRVEPGAVVARLKAADPAQARHLLAALLEAAPGRALEAARELAGSPDAALQLAVLDLLVKAPSSEEVARQIAAQITSPIEEVRLRAMKVAADRRELRAFDIITKEIQNRGAGLSEAEAEVMGESLARLLLATALPLFAGWVRAKHGLLRRLGEGPVPRMQLWLAASGLRLIPGEEPEALIKQISARASDDEALKEHCVEVMRRRRKERMHHG